MADPAPAAGVVSLNLALFIILTSLPAFQERHHHWIFPALATLFGLQYLFLRRFGRGRWGWTPAAETAVLSLLAFLLGMGVVRHHSILTCFGNCGLKLSAACALAAGALFLHGAEERPGFWDPLRSRSAGAAAAAWSLYLALRGPWIPPWALDALFASVSLLLWLGRGHGFLLILFLGVTAAGAARMTGSEPAIIALDLALVASLLWGGAHRLAAWGPRLAAPLQDP